ncbi:hypothetical protein NE237_003199 [Protea cynaroides]|uniref:Uncharacterized protein n=1 Tax=Protea cynaroides TaxID=273540 RepID=A0A9Q0KGM5_9MAGN|nr:hypothetical protein NE237_003199 [Protea cynaroides]
MRLRVTLKLVIAAEITKASIMRVHDIYENLEHRGYFRRGLGIICPFEADLVDTDVRGLWIHPERLYVTLMIGYGNLLTSSGWNAFAENLWRIVSKFRLE